jgi:hypothetical protein
MANLYDKAQYIFVAGANKSGSLYGMSPIAGTTNVTLVSGSTTRAASGSRTNSGGIIEGVAPHILRVDYSDLVSCPSYKFETIRTNYILNSDHLATGSNPNGWAATNTATSIVADSTSPVGTGFTGLIRENSDTNRDHYILNSFAGAGAVAAGNKTLSVYVKRSGSGADTRNVMILVEAALSSAAGAYFILEGTGSVSSTIRTNVSGAYIEPLPNGWYRCSVLAGYPTATGQMRIYLTSGSTYTETYNGNGTAGLYVCGAQAESGSAMGNRDVNTYNTLYNWGTPVTAYISSSTSTPGTRNAGDQTILLPSSSNTSAWTAFVTYKQSDPSPQGNSAIFSVRAPLGSEYAGFYAGGRPVWSGSGVPAGSPSGSQVFTNIEHKVALRLSGNQLTWFRDGARLFSITWPATGTWRNFHIGSIDTSTEAITSRGSFYVRVASMFNQSLSDNECQALTATGSGTV